MIHISKTEEPSRTLLTIDGQLSGDSIDVIETCCTQARSGGKAVQVFLRDVTGVDQGGRMLLSRLIAKGIRLAASGVYTSYLVQELSPAEPAHGNGVSKAARKAQ
jgi:hypothetical protein